MLRRLIATATASGALAVLALGSTAVASAHRGHAAVHPTRSHHVTGATVRRSATAGERSSADPGTSSGAEASGAEPDGPGGHQDPAGVNVDHQFQGQE